MFRSPKQIVFHISLLILIVLFQSCIKEDVDLFHGMEAGSYEFTAENIKYTFSATAVDAFLQPYVDESESIFISCITEELEFIETSMIIIISESRISNSTYPLEHVVGTLTFYQFHYFQVDMNGGFSYDYYADPEGALEISEIDRSNNTVTGTFTGKFKRTNHDSVLKEVDPPPSIVDIEGRFYKIPLEMR